jgi:hypothetical protein
MNERTQTFLRACQQAGVLPSAMPDAIRHLELKFQHEPYVSPEAAQAAADLLPAERPHYFPGATLSPEVPTVRSRRPAKMALKLEQQREVYAKPSPTERLTAAREIEARDRTKA